MEPQAYNLALSQRAQLLRRLHAVEERMASAGRTSMLRSFRAVLDRRRIAVNMRIPKLARFLDEGQYLNVYELTAKQTGASGAELAAAVERELASFKDERLAIDRLFRFGPDAHYAALNLGGAGLTRYGDACVVFRPGAWCAYSTCFAGDSIRLCFSAAGSLAVSEAMILSDFAPGEDAVALAVVAHADLLDDDAICIDPVDVRRRLETGDLALEMHLHGAVTRDLIAEVIMERRRLAELEALSRKYDLLPGLRPFAYDIVPEFRLMLALLDGHGIPLVTAEVT
jgi:hypothetical protein